MDAEPEELIAFCSMSGQPATTDPLHGLLDPELLKPLELLPAAPSQRRRLRPVGMHISVWGQP